MPIPTENVGSLPRPTALQKAITQYDAGEIDVDALRAEQDAAVRDSIIRMEATGSWIVSDGEQRASSFATYPMTETLAGTGLADTLGPGGQRFAIFDDGHDRQLPRLARGPFRYRAYAADHLRRSLPFATRPMKQAVISPSMLSLLYPLDETVDGYTRAQFHDDLVDECEKDIRQCFAAGAARVSIDFTEGRLARKNDPRIPWTGRDMLREFIDLNNRVLDRFTAEERRDIGIHTCPGGDLDSAHSLDVDYAELLPLMFGMNAGYFLIQLSGEQDKERVCRLVGEHSRAGQMCFVGVIDPINPVVETPEQVRDLLVLAAKSIPRERLGATDDCGFSPFSLDRKPRHGSPDVARDIAFEKIQARIEGVALASAALGI